MPPPPAASPLVLRWNYKILVEKKGDGEGNTVETWAIVFVKAKGDDAKWKPRERPRNEWQMLFHGSLVAMVRLPMSHIAGWNPRHCIELLYCECECCAAAAPQFYYHLLDRM